MHFALAQSSRIMNHVPPEVCAIRTNIHDALIDAIQAMCALQVHSLILGPSHTTNENNLMNSSPRDDTTSTRSLDKE